MKSKVISILFIGLFSVTIALGQTNTYPASGNVGIGTTTPGEKLEVNGLIKIPVANNQDNNSPGITALSNDDFLYDGEYINHYGFGFHSYSQSPSNGRNAYIAGYFGMDIFTAGANRLRISQNGKGD